MANMTYCAFENTLANLRQLKGMLEDEVDNKKNSLERFVQSRSCPEEGQAVRSLSEEMLEILFLLGEMGCETARATMHEWDDYNR